MNTPNPWIPFFTTALLGILSLVSVCLGHYLGLGREARSKSIDIRLRRRQRWEEFEEKSLIEFQNAMAGFIQVASRVAANAAVLVGSKHTGTEVQSKSADAYSIALMEFGPSQALIVNHMTRIQDNETRNLAIEFVAAGVMISQLSGKLIKDYNETGSDDISQLTAANTAMMSAFAKASGRIGESIRSEMIAEKERAKADAIAEQASREKSFGRRVIKAGQWVWQRRPR